MNLKKAPQQEILSIDRTGEWGRVEYRHRLACGHTELRKRPSTAPKIACSWCVIAEEKGEELSTLATRDDFIDVPVEEAWYDADAEHEVDAGRLRAGLVLSLGLPPESIEVVSEVNEFGDLQVRYVVAYMDVATAKRIANVN
jgi:hypothetical protein